jgi:hypothetical protein
MGASVSKPPSSIVASTDKPAVPGIPVPPPLSDSKVPSDPTPAESERILVQPPEETGPGSFEDLHRKCKGNLVFVLGRFFRYNFFVHLHVDNVDYPKRIHDTLQRHIGLPSVKQLSSW